MKLIRELPSSPIFTGPAAITIGNFDGMHLGHQAVIRKLIETARLNGVPSIVLSYENHPAEVIHPNLSICKICTPEHKIHLLKEMGIDLLVLINFTKEFSQQSAEEFLLNLQKQLPYSHLVLGWDATLGKDKQGSPQIVQEIAKKNQFYVDYLNQQKVEDLPVSSSQIRKFIQEGKLEKAQKLLGRRYSIFSKVYKGEGKGKNLGFPTANFRVQGLCLPPLGVYAVTCMIDKLAIKGIANLGIAPTMRDDQIPLLEVHIFDKNEDLYGKEIEVIFSSFIRPEKKFSNIEELKAQIQNDIYQAKECLKKDNVF